jgi:hypothetical protein
MAGDAKDMAPLGARLVIGAIAGITATIAFTSTVKKLKTRKERDSTPAASPGALAVAAPFALGALAGAIHAAANPRPNSLTGALAGGGLWLAGEMNWLPDIAVRPAGAGPAPRSAALLAAHVAWGWSAAEAIGELSPD